jgi:hypothetical protein
MKAWIFWTHPDQYQTGTLWRDPLPQFAIGIATTKERPHIPVHIPLLDGTTRGWNHVNYMVLGRASIWCLVDPDQRHFSSCALVFYTLHTYSRFALPTGLVIIFYLITTVPFTVTPGPTLG